MSPPWPHHRQLALDLEGVARPGDGADCGELQGAFRSARQVDTWRGLAQNLRVRPQAAKQEVAHHGRRGRRLASALFERLFGLQAVQVPVHGGDGEELAAAPEADDRILPSQ